MIKALWREKIIIFSFCYLISFRPILFFIKGINYLYFSFLGKIDTLIAYTLLFLLLGFSFFASINKNKKNIDTFILFMIFLLSYVVSFTIIPENREYMFTSVFDYTFNPLYLFIIYAFPGYFLIRSISNYKLLTKYLYIFSAIVLISSILYYFIFVSLGFTIEYMTFSYNFLLHLVFLIIYFLFKKGLFSFLLSVVGIIMIVLTGARGPLVISLLSAVTFLLFSSLRDKKGRVTLLITPIFVLLFLVYYDDLFKLLFQLSSYLNIDSRTLSFIVQDNFFDGDSRLNLFNNSIKYINLTGYGMFGDRLLLDGTYPHNIFLEILLHFGYIIGTLIILLVSFLFLRTGITKNIYSRILFFSFLSIGFFKLLITGTYLTEPGFYILLGISVSQLVSKSKISLAIDRS